MDSKNKLGFKCVIRGLTYAFTITLILLFAFSLILRFTSLSETKTIQFNIIVMILGVAVASFYIGMKLKEKGWLNGAIIGFIYYLIIILINITFLKGDSTMVLLVSKLFLSTLTGFIGGMIGVNIG
ncbi:TIGR04086 family membrane protein [Tissierella creatinini]|nr:TIGR04086 family membrane protein [Tissierella creatinini]TJX69239.1 TIGR04086 family membrane protein [Soehngenia saccharolytica]